MIPGRQDAWRCSTAESPSTALDPCFRNVFQEDQLLCVQTPWAESGVALDLTEPLPDAESLAPSETLTPWGIETDSGVRCTRRLGTPDVIGDLSFTYSCRSDDSLSPTGLLAIDLDQQDPLWTATLAQGAERTTEPVAIAVVWY